MSPHALPERLDRYVPELVIFELVVLWMKLASGSLRGAHGGEDRRFQFTMLAAPVPRRLAIVPRRSGLVGSQDGRPLTADGSVSQGWPAV